MKEHGLYKGATIDRYFVVGTTIDRCFDEGATIVRSTVVLMCKEWTGLLGNLS